MALVQIRSGAQAPERVRFAVSNAGGAAEPLDLTTVTAAALNVTRGDGSRVVWTPTTISQAAGAMLLEHVFSLLDTAPIGVYRVDIQLTVPSGTRRAGPTAFEVIE